jgi:hypothetical protein
MAQNFFVEDIVWVGEGTRANLATTPDGDLVKEDKSSKNE